MLAEGKQTVTSGELAKRIGNTSAQVRQDFFTCGGVENYHPDTLKNWLSGLLGIKKEHHMVVVGAGNLGRAIISFRDFNTDGFFINAVFDNNLMFEGMQVCGIPVLNMNSFEEYLAANKVDIVIITTPANVAEEILEKIDGEGVTKQKVVARLGQLVKAEKAHKEQIKVEGRKIMAYRLEVPELVEYRLD
jgi:redox-sensing transcriptional repressor